MGSALITGATSGIGLEFAWELAAERNDLVLVARNLERLEEVAEEIRQVADVKVEVLQADLATEEGARTVAARVQQAHHPIGLLVNNAGWDVFKPFTKTNEGEWQQLIAINLVGALHMHHAVLPKMAERKAGRIVNIASDAARVGSSGEAVYAACKGGLVALSKTLAREHARHNITVNVVCPGPTDTALFASYKDGASNPEKLLEAFTRSIPLGRIGQPEDLPGAILFFASSDAAYVTGQVISVSGGLTMAG